MIPSLAADELREAIVEYLSTTFALSDDATREALAEFLLRSDDGIFRGPFLRVRTPFRPVADDWVSPLDWMPADLRPYRHQARAFERLSSRDQAPQPTLVTTGTGSGKTESFLVPILDHCRRQRALGRQGVKALLLYPMNALASDQARRLAGYLHDDPSLAGVTAGLYVGGEAGHSEPGPDHLVDDRHELRRNPPDILLTNYKMLDFLLLRGEDRALWNADGAHPLQYVVLDEFHTYDGAQGTDVAMLLRRLGKAIGVARPGRPLGDIAAVGTSATLGSGTDGIDEMCRFAGQVFGMAFGPDAVIGEDRQTIDEACGTVDYTRPIPTIDDVLAVSIDDPQWHDHLAALFTGSAEPLDPISLGTKLLTHTLTRGVLDAGAEHRDWRQTISTVIGRDSGWGREAARDPHGVGAAISRYVALLSLARRADAAGRPTRPLFGVEVQLWVREVSRLLRRVEQTPRFRWADSGSADLDGDEQPDEQAELPAIYCRVCGRTGWMATAGELDGSLVLDPTTVYAQARKRPARQRALLLASELEADAQRLDVDQRRVSAAPTAPGLPVLVTASDDHAERERCPSCHTDDAIRFLGSRVASLASVTISQLFGSKWLDTDERKLLAFTDSVQDASHRAGFFAGRTHRFNLRTAMAQGVHAADSLSLADLADAVVASAADPGSIHALCPPDLLADSHVAALWGDAAGDDPVGDDPVGRQRLTDRLRLEAVLEFGLRSRVGRTMELTGTAVADVAVPDPELIASLVAEHRARYRAEHPAPQAELPLDGGGGTGADMGTGGSGAAVADYDAYLAGVLARIRLRGAIVHPWLENYIRHDGNRYQIWGGRPAGMPAFAKGQSAPTFFSVGTVGDFDDVDALGRTPSWLVDWAMRTLHCDAAEARAVNRFTFALLAQHDVLTERTTTRGLTVYGLEPHTVRVVAVPTDDADTHPALVRCDVCAGRHAVQPEAMPAWTGRPCLRYRCAGHYGTIEGDRPAYYRSLYLSDLRRVIATEHTGGLTNAERDTLERSFKAGGPTAPNVVTCTPTLELGIDIGDLSAVMLTSMPRGAANYIQRVGRAGRSTGNAFIASFLPADPRSLSFLAEPRRMLAGEVRPPNCYLDAIELLRRQYLAYLLDRVADGSIDIGPYPHSISQVVETRGDGWMQALLGAHRLAGTAFVDEFLGLYDGLDAATVEAMHDWASNGLDVAVKLAFETWREQRAALANQIDRLKRAIDQTTAAVADTEQASELRRLNGERNTITRRLRDHRSAWTPTGLEKMGLLPNYTLLDEAATLDALLWWHDEDDNYGSERLEYRRPAWLAVNELAPGSSFYGRGLRLVIDGLDIGSASEPEYEHWRLCPECAYGANDAARDAWASCPRCGSRAIADAGARHLVHRFRRVTTIENRDRARAFDEHDEREREQFDTITTIDIDVNDVAEAWEHATVPFGAEFARSAVVRTLNLGPTARPGSKVVIAGHSTSASRFATCRYCGVVDRARTEVRGNPRAHRASCYVRAGSRTELWDEPILVHELRTEAVRVLVPVSVVQDTERLVSFKGALLLGLREVFGGEPEHLTIALSDAPNAGGSGRRRFLVALDAVPGGTGYLARLAEPDRLREILERARLVISRCDCHNTGRVACHRCLLGGLSSREVPHATRKLALELLDVILADWQMNRVLTVAERDIGAVEESELERRFRMALDTWAKIPASAARATVTPLPNGRASIDLRLTGRDGDRRWRIEEQTKVSGAPSSVPDFVITRLDSHSKPIAVFLDGYQFHASPAHNHLARDAAQRAELRRAGSRVWALTWADVEAFDKAVSQAVPTDPADRPLLRREQRVVAQQYFNARCPASNLDAPLLDRNPVRLLLDYLREPDDARWSFVARAAVTAAMSAGTRTELDRASLAATAGSILTGELPEPPPPGQQAMHGAAATLGGLTLHGLLDMRTEVGGPNAERWTVISVLDDRDTAVAADAHRARWLDWLGWSNVLQFLDGDGREFVATTVCDVAKPEPIELSIVPAAPAAPPGAATDAAATDTTVTAPAAVADDVAGLGAGAAGEAPLPEDVLEELGFVIDDHARALAESMLRRGAPSFVAGYEPSDDGAGWQLDVAWVDRRIGILAATDSPDAIRDAWLARQGWTVKASVDWTPEALSAALWGKR